MTGQKMSLIGWERTPWHATQRAAWERCDEPARMARPRILLVGGKPLVAAMLTE
jgi:hypothetical protein